MMYHTTLWYPWMHGTMLSYLYPKTIWHPSVHRTMLSYLHYTLLWQLSTHKTNATLWHLSTSRTNATLWHLSTHWANTDNILTRQNPGPCWCIWRSVFHFHKYWHPLYHLTHRHPSTHRTMLSQVYPMTLLHLSTHNHAVYILLHSDTCQHIGQRCSVLLASCNSRSHLSVEKKSVYLGAVSLTM